MSVDMNRQTCRPTSGRYFTATRPILHHHSAATRPILYQHSAATRPILHHHSAATRPPLGRYFTNTRPTLNSLGQLLLPPEFYLPCSTERGFQWPSSFFGLQLRQYSCLFSSYVFSSSSLLYTTLITFGCSSIWGLLLLEARYFRGAKDDIKSWYDCALFLPHGWVFFSSRPRDISQLFVA